MIWNVYRYDINRNQISIFNIFDHWKFNEEVDKHRKECKTKDEFAEKVKRELMYYFWSKSEWELIIRQTDNQISLIPWCGCRNTEEVKINVEDDENFNWTEFTDFHTKRQVYKNEAKIDVYDQVMSNFDRFIDYVWNYEKYSWSFKEKENV